MRAVRAVLFGAVIASCTALHAAHYSGGDITYQCTGPNTYLITLNLFRDCSGFSMVPQTLNFSNDCGLSFSINALPVPPAVEVSQLCAAQLPNSSCNGGGLPGIDYYQFTTTVVLAPCNDWTISWNICCWNTSNNVVATPTMYLSTTLNNALVACDNSPVFTDESVPYVCVNQPVFYNYGVNEPDGDSITYQLVGAQSYSGGPLPITYQATFSGAAPIPGIVLDPFTGQLVFTPTLIGNYIVAIQVNEYNSLGQLIGTVTHEQLFVVLNCTGSAPATAGLTNNTAGILTGTNSIQVCDGQAFCVDVVFTDADPGTVLQVTSNAAALLPGSTFTLSGTNPVTATLCWTGDITNSPVNVLVQADDGACPVENIASTSINITTVNGGGPVPDPGINAAIAVCSNAAVLDLFTVLGGTPDPGGSWLDPSSNAFSGMFDPGVDPLGVYTYVVGNACNSLSAQVTVSQQTAPDAGSNGTLTICSSGAAVNMFASLGGAPVVGGSWTGPGAAAHSNIYNPAVDASGVYTYTVLGVLPCGSASATVTVTENAAPNAGVDGALALCSSSAATGLFASLVGAQAGGTWTAPGGAAFSGTYDPSVNASGAYTYTVNGTAPCPNDQAIVTVTENAAPNAGVDGTLTICSSGAATNMFTLLGGAPQAGGIWTAPGGAAHANTYDPAADASGIYTYTVNGTAPCPNDQAMVTVTENAAPNAGLDGAITLCSSSAATGLFASLIGAQAGGTWTAPGGAAFSGTYDPSVNVSGAYTYTVNGTAPCPNDQAIVTVTENAAPNAGIDGAITLCSSSAATGLFASLVGAQAGGTWTAPGGAAFTGTYDPSVNAAGAYTYTVNGTAPCPNDQAIVTVTENAAPNAGIDGAITLCSSSAATGLFASLIGAQAGGTWTAPGGAAFSGTYDPSVNASGAYTYTVNGTAPCPNDQAIVTVTENAAPNAGLDGVITLCSSSAATGLFASLVGAQAGGTWTAPGGAAFTGTYDPSVNAAGAYTYTVNGTAPCPNDQAIVTVTENAAPNAGIDGAITLCSSSAATGLFASLVGAQAGGTWTAPGGAAFSGTYDPTLNASGAYTYTVNGTAPCPNDQATVTVTENAAPNAGLDGVITLCSSSAATGLFASLVGAQAGGTWTAPGGAAFSGTYDPSANASGAYTYTVTGTAPCPNDQSIVTVTENAAPSGTIAYAGSPFCVGAGVVAVTSTATAGGVFSSTAGLSINAITGDIDLTASAPGSYTVTYSIAAAGGCPAFGTTAPVTINPGPFAGADGAITLCSSSAATGLFPSLVGAQAGGTWTAPGGAVFSGSYDPSVNASGAYIYTVNGVAPCLNDQAIVTVTENAAPNAGVDGAITLCSSGATTGLFASLVGAQAGGTWTAPGGAAFSGTYDPALNAPGAYTYTVNGIAPCPNDQSIVTVTETPAPNAGVDGSLTVCDIGGAVALFASLGGSPDAGGAWTTSGGVAFSGTYDPAIDAPDVFTYTVNGIAPCPNDQATVTVSETGTPDAGLDGAITLCDNGAITALFTLLTGADPGGTWADPGGMAHSGSLDPATDPSGAYTYSLAAIGPCPGDQSIVNVAINTSPDAGADGAITVCDIGAAVALFTSLGGTPDAGGSWTTSGGAASGGTYDPAIDAPDVFTYTVNGTAPCGNDQATVTVSETGTPDAGLDGAITLCDNGAITALFTLLTGADPGGSWTDPGGVAHSASLDPATDPAGVYTYTIAATAPCISDQSIVSVAIDPQPDAGIDNSVQICAGDPPIPLFSLLGGAPDAGGAWSDPLGLASTGTFDPALSTPGAYTYTVANGVCAPDQSMVTITISSGPNAGADNAVALCENGPVIDLAGLLAGTPDPGGAWTDSGGNAIGNLFDPSTGSSGAYTYTVTGVGSCTTAQAVLTLAVNTLASAGSPGAILLCGSSPPAPLFGAIGGAPVAGGSWTAPGGTPFTGTFDPAVDPAGVYTYAVSASAPCPVSSTTVTVGVASPADAGVDGSALLCSSDAVLPMFGLLGGAPQAGGAWTDPGGSATTGSFDPASTTVGTYTYTVTGITPCPDDQALVIMAVNNAADAGIDGSITLCDNAAPIDLFNQLGGSPDAGGFWADGGGSVIGSTLDPATSTGGTFTYTVDAVAPCPLDLSVVTVNVITMPQPAISWTAESGCAPILATFTSDYAGTGSLLWDLGNGSTSSDPSPDSVLYDVPGAYAITLTIDPGFGCASTTALSPALVVAASPVAAFTFSPAIITTTDPLVHFNNGSQDAGSWLWQFDLLGTSVEEDPNFLFPETTEGTYQVCLTAFSSPTCYDTICQLIDVLIGPTIFVPNTFTPEGNGTNDDFGPSVLGITAFHFWIFDRWGQPLFESTDPAIRWNGFFAGGAEVPEGVYIWKLTAQDPFSTQPIERIGHVTLLR